MRKSPSVNNIRILGCMLVMYRRIKKQERYLKSYLPGLLRAIVPDYQETFSAKDVKRITKYWQLALNLVCDNVYKLTGKKLSEAEHKSIILLSVFGPLFDDLFDDHILNYEQITSLVTAPEEYKAINKNDRLAKDLYLELLRSIPRRQQFIEHLQAVAHWQQESLKQLNSDISAAELQEITYKKSYYAVLLFCSLLDNYPDQKILEILYPAAGLMQLTNDAFDVWKDVHKGVYTLPNLYRNFLALKQLFLTETSTINHHLWQLPYPARAKQTFAIIIHSLHAMGWMSLEQLQQVTVGVTSIEELKQLSRKELVCDMDSFSQQLKWLRHIRTFTNYIDK
ncbi:hypothetical protein A4H97_00170 [Niastella yeongjuensis]|uniref:Uncharacterized protein n=1 Tax=Niastella yeongjuensis TaxID=354355 RepID=A0A1V9EVX9_9BACT|nr:class 1 isoprenoid biosynthesis enzyme [Niastella yeongjuensis]OQP50299.1 hypothetical protein A4H97_00170 [Niastella yeongjuensis]SEN40599.1 hypothetical protein SAMN05660816_00917 [Niastella yeongjuensis]